MLTQSQVPGSRTEQVVKYQIQTKRQTSHTRHTIKKKRKKDKTSLPPVSTQTQTTCMREESHPKDKNKKRKTTRHIPASPASITPRPGTQTHNPIPSATHSTFLLLLPTLPAYIPAMTHRHCTTTHVYILAATVPMPVSVSLPLALNTVVPLPDGRYAMPPPAIYHAHLYRYQPDCCLHTVHMSVCTTALVCYSTMPTVLGSATVLTILHRPHPLRVTLVACATTSPLRESTLTPCRFHHPYRSLTLAHRVVPPLVVPVPSLAVLLSACPWWFPLLVSLRSLTLAYRLTPMVTCCSLSARPHIMHHYLPASPCTHTCQHSCIHACRQFCPHHAYSTSSSPASMTLRA